MRPLSSAVSTQLSKLLAISDPLLDFKWVAKSLPFGHPLEYLEALDLPFLNIEVGDKQHINSGYLYFPTTHDISAFNATFYEDSDATSLQWITAWKNKVKDFRTGLYGLPGIDGSGYKQDIVAELQDTAGNAVVTVKLLGCWPTATSNFSLTYTGNGRLTVVQSFSIDDQNLEFHYNNARG